MRGTALFYLLFTLPSLYLRAHAIHLFCLQPRKRLPALLRLTALDKMEGSASAWVHGRSYRDRQPAIHPRSIALTEIMLTMVPTI